MQLAARVQDVNKDGTITRSDFDLMVKNYKDLGMPEEYTQELCDVIYGMCDSLGLLDNSISISYDELTEMWIENLEKQEDFALDRFERIFYPQLIQDSDVMGGWSKI